MERLRISNQRYSGMFYFLLFRSVQLQLWAKVVQLITVYHGYFYLVTFKTVDKLQLTVGIIDHCENVCEYMDEVNMVYAWKHTIPFLIPCQRKKVTVMACLQVYVYDAFACKTHWKSRSIVYELHIWHASYWALRALLNLLKIKVIWGQQRSKSETDKFWKLACIIKHGWSSYFICWATW